MAGGDRGGPHSPEPGDSAADFRKTFNRHTKDTAQVRIPIAGQQVHQRGPRGGGAVSGKLPGQPVQQKGVGGAEAQAALRICEP